MTDNQTAVKQPHPLLVEFQKIVDGLPKMAKTLPGFTDVIMFIAKVVKALAALEERVVRLESNATANK